MQGGACIIGVLNPNEALPSRIELLEKIVAANTAYESDKAKSDFWLPYTRMGSIPPTYERVFYDV